MPMDMRLPTLRHLCGMFPRRVPPHGFFVVSAIFHYLGPAFAVLLFARVDVLGVAWLRIVSAALIFAGWRRPWRALAGIDRGGRRLLLAWGCVLALMNCCFYLAIDRQPIASVAAIEFLPVVALAALGVRTHRNVAAVVLAVIGVYLVTGVQLALAPLGVAFAFANAVLFALYIVLADSAAKRLAHPASASGARPRVASTGWQPRCWSPRPWSRLSRGRPPSPRWATPSRWRPASG